MNYKSKNKWKGSALIKKKKKKRTEELKPRCKLIQNSFIFGYVKSCPWEANVLSQKRHLMSVILVVIFKAPKYRCLWAEMSASFIIYSLKLMTHFLFIFYATDVLEWLFAVVNNEIKVIHKKFQSMDLAIVSSEFFIHLIFNFFKLLSYF